MGFGAKSILALLLSQELSTNAGNLVFNSGFELGDCGYSAVRYLRPDANPNLKCEKAAIDCSSSASGRQSLKIPNPHAEHIRILAGEFKLKPGAPCIFSFAAKSEAPDCVANVFITSIGTGGWSGGDESFKIGKDWKTYEYSFTPRKDQAQPYYSLRIEFCRERGAKPGAIWLDELRLEETSKKGGAYQPAAAIEACSRFESSVVVIPPEGKASTIATCVVNNSDRRQKAKLKASIVEDLAGSLQERIDGASFEIAAFDVELAPREMKRIETSVKLCRYGAFRLDTEVKSEAKSMAGSDYFVAVAPIAPKLIDLDKSFCAGINAGLGLLKPPLWGELEKPGYRMAIDQEELFRTYAKLGFRLLRDWDGGYPAFQWKDIEPEPGKFDFSLADKMVDDAARCGLRVLPVLGGSDFEVDEDTGRSNWPAWLEPLCRDLKGNGAWKLHVRIPPIERWRLYVGAVARHFKGRLTHYEIINEAEGYISAEDYMDFLRAAQEEIKKSDPAAKIAGFCATSDKGGDGKGFLGKCLAAGGAAYADAACFHPYEAASLASAEPADIEIAAMKAMLARADARKTPLWMTELYYLTGKGEGSGKGLCQPEDAACRFLTDLGEGVRQSTPLCASDGFKRLHAPHFNTGMAASYEHPSGVLSVYNALTLFFEGAKPSAKLKWADEAICYVYEKDGKSLAAFWRYGGKRDISVKFQEAPKGLRLHDLYGNRMDFSNPLSIGRSPRYLKPAEGMDNEAFLSLLKSARASATP